MIYQYARALYLHQGGDPSILDDVPMQDIDAWLALHHVFEARSSLGGLQE